MASRDVHLLTPVTHDLVREQGHSSHRPSAVLGQVNLTASHGALAVEEGGSASEILLEMLLCRLGEGGGCQPRNAGSL